MIEALSARLLCRLAGELSVRLAGLPVPGPLVGTALLLGPATVALAVPLYQNAATVRRVLLPMAAALLAGSVTAVLSAVAIAVALGGSPQTVISLAPESVTTPIAMGIAGQLGGIPSLTAVLVILTGITGAVIGTPLLDLLRQRAWRARAASRSAWRRTASARPARSRSTTRRAPSPGSAWR